MKAQKLFFLLLFISLNISGQTYDISWINTSGCNVTGGSLTKNASNSWGNAGGESENLLANNTSGTIQFTAQAVGHSLMIGLSSQNTDNDWSSIKYAIYLKNGGTLQVRESGSNALYNGSYTIGDVFKIERNANGNILYKKNNSTFYTSASSYTGQLIADAALYHNGASTGNMTASFDVPSTGPTCTDGIQNGDETGIDCGGSCPNACATCTDGIQNGDETGIDCGGSCPNACATCSDGIQNGDETGIDCGGSCPNACATCSDGIQNGDETGIDCGGSCPNACGGSGGSTVWTQSGNDIHYSDGKVWIGDVSLDVASTDYNLFVEKGIMTERLKVAIEGSGDWADYVFKNGYQLMSLEEVRTHIAQYGHLPNVPSAEQVANQGIDVSKMFPILLRQIEENKLYLIQMNEQIKALKEENTQLKKQISKKVK